MMGVAAVAAGNLPHQRQPQPHIAGLLGIAVHPIEGLEEIRSLIIKYDN